MKEFYTPLPRLRAELGLVASYGREQAERIRQGFEPRDMDDRWALRFDLAADVLRIHRSWSGFCVFEIGFAWRDESLVVRESWVNRDAEQYRGSDVAADRLTATRLIDRLLLGR